MPSSARIAFFISPHGFGHAARASAVISVLQQRRPALHIDLYSQTPTWFFNDSLSGSYAHHELLTDVGLAQINPLEVDLPATLKRLDGFLPFSEDLLETQARQLKQSHCRLVVCDISPLGIAVAARAGIPSVLIENFTWDWIYKGYSTFDAPFAKHTEILKETFAKARFRIQVQPNCSLQPADLTTGPVSRKPKKSRQETREQLKIPDRKKLVLITMGGIPDTYRFLDPLRKFSDCCFLVPGSNVDMEVHGNLTLLPYHSRFHHPDLVQAADVVIGKVGYSTLAEVYHAGIPFGYFTRPGFRESDVLAAFVQEQMQGVALQGCEYRDGSWITRLPELLELPLIKRNDANGADCVVAFLDDLICQMDGTP